MTASDSISDSLSLGERAARTGADARRCERGLKRGHFSEPALSSACSANFCPKVRPRCRATARALAAPSAPRRMGRRWKALQVAVPLLPIPLGCWFLYKAIASFNRSPPPYAISDPKKVMEMPLYSEPVYQARRAHSPVPHQHTSQQPLPPPRAEDRLQRLHVSAKYDSTRRWPDKVSRAGHCPAHAPPLHWLYDGYRMLTATPALSDPAACSGRPGRVVYRLFIYSTRTHRHCGPGRTALRGHRRHRDAPRTYVPVRRPPDGADRDTARLHKQRCMLGLRRVTPQSSAASRRTPRGVRTVMAAPGAGGPRAGLRESRGLPEDLAELAAAIDVQIVRVEEEQH